MEMTAQMGTAVADKPLEVRPGFIELLLMHVIWDPVIFNLCYAELDPDMLSKPSETAYRHIWAEMKAFYDEHGVMPKLEAISARVASKIETDPLALADPTTGAQLLENAQDLLSFAYNRTTNPPGCEEPHEAKKVLRAILIDRGPEEELRRAVTNAVGHRVINLPKLVEKAQARIQDIESIGKAEDERITVPTSWAQTARPKWPTGVDFVDNIMGGGSEPGDCNVIIGPTGGGKTTLSMQLACSTARLQGQLARRGTDGDPGLVVFVSYEDGRRMLQVRSVSYSARILKDRLRDMTSDTELSRVGRLEEYEQRMYQRQGNPEEQLGELERIEQNRPWMDKHLVLVDFNDPKVGGRGHVTEVKQKLIAIQEDRGMPIKMVVLDWAGDLVANYLMATKGQMDGGQMTLELQNLVNRAKREIAGPLNCCVWIPHQLKSSLTNRPPAKMPHHSETQWCAAFADHAWYAFVIGNKDQEHNVCQFGATKTRHGETPPPTILKIDGAVCRMVDVAKHFEVDEVTRRLTPRSDLARVHSNISRQHQTVNVD